MSEAKRKELIKAGQLRKDGSRIEVCPLCGNELTAEQVEAIRGAPGSATGEAEATAAGVEVQS